MKKFDERQITQFMKSNQRIEIMIDSEPQERFSSRIEELKKDEIIIAMPMRKNRPLVLKNGSEFELRMVVDQKVYHLTCVLLGRQYTPLPVWMISHPLAVQHMQQRSFVRLYTSLPVRWRKMTEFEAQPVACTCRDISGGGIRIITKQQIPLKTRLKLWIDFPEDGQVEVVGQVVRSERPQRDAQVFWIGVEFSDVSEQTRSKIIKFIFKKQLDVRRRIR